MRDEVGGEVGRVDEEARVEGALGGVAVEGREDQPGGEEDEKLQNSAEAARRIAIDRPARTHAAGMGYSLAGLDQVAEPLTVWIKSTPSFFRKRPTNTSMVFESRSKSWS